jgi:hypothetical protein
MPDEPSNPTNSSPKGFLHWLGRQVGFVKKAIETDVSTPGPKTIYRDTKIEEKHLPQDPNVKLRRTIIDEVIQEKPKDQKE